MTVLITIIISYLVGSISGSYIIGKVFLNKDVRKYGSGNAGTTNAIRVFGIKWGIITFLIDFLKGIIIVLLSKNIFKVNETLVLINILFGIVGHDYPFYMRFKGGKGVATTLGALLIMNFQLTFFCFLIWIFVTMASKMVSLGSIFFFVSIIVLFLSLSSYNNLGLSIIFIIGLLGIYKHRSNIKRIINGTENKIGAVKK
ncbi:glycerol-3-phosphate 1-O-acyltransferase PlsY [Peptoniphilus sp. oral taxon 386]|uniref:glycerol-3-phosphate 1-O-acyltransferase PlsY n=1 Tax=Peptoniphilus sp. oral taxon 386 TaxID=652713 RepID=UPI0001DA9B42|nr:glycerol-3-phosphate 1-O-acyltransferase PlsY [Peptoniphilus sp. oral taxon 386]EFI42315.1 acyl-phosphate glycerol 3-phosphate acyltransferase [Peptoniphilus sp. oral taxon 386 str. F0131]